MGFFDNIENVNEYINMSNGYDGKDLIEVLKTHLHAGSTVLELGMGPGKDLDILFENYSVTGSDFSTLFLELYRKTHSDADLLRLDAIELNTDRKFDCIYSNKVLHHITQKELQKSFNNQLRLLNENGMAFHSFWYGDKEENHHGLRFVYYTQKILEKIIPKEFEIIEFNRYTELATNDSFYIILKKMR